MMNSFKHLDNNANFIVKSSFFTTLLLLFFLTPFSVNNFIQGRIELGFGSLAIIVLCAINTWNCIKDKFQPLVILTGIVPFIIVFLVLSFREQGIIGVFWSYPAVLLFYFILPGRYAWLANTLLIVLVVPEAWSFLETPLAVRFAVTLISSSLLAGIFIWFITLQQNKLMLMAMTDPLTQLFNRTELDSSLKKSVEQFQENQTSCTILMLDLDHFKSINDTLGHYTGDDVLRAIGQYFNKNTVNENKAFRIGGEEFIVLMHSTSLAQAKIAAEKMRSDIASLPLLPDRQVTTSIGVAELSTNDTVSSWMKRCDENLYQAKLKGRNQVI